MAIYLAWLTAYLVKQPLKLACVAINIKRKEYGTAIRSCRDLDGNIGFQVTLNNCPVTASEPACAL